MSKWYKGVYRRHLMDMHVNDDKELYLSKFDPQKYFENLKKAKIQSPMIYLQSHPGLCYFPTETAKTHNAMRGENNKIKTLIDLCKKDGMKVVGYYSLIFNNWAEDNHPEWAIRRKSGKTQREEEHGRYGLCCPNNAEYRKFVVKQIKEIFAYCKNLDGIFYDMPFWATICYCDACKKRLKAEYGIDIPDKDLRNGNFRKFMIARQDWMAEFCEFVKNETLKINPDITVEFNYAAAINSDWLAGSTEKIAKESEFVGGDLYGGLRKHSFACKYYYYVTNEQPFEYMTCRCDDNLTEHTLSKTEEDMTAEIMLNCAHHGASLSIDAINLDGTMDGRVYDRLGKVFEKQLPYEKFMDKGELYSEVAVYFNSDIQYSLDNAGGNKECAISAHTALLEKHIPCSVIANFPKKELYSYQAIIAPSLIKSENSITKRLIDYVKNGGHLYISGESEPELIKEFFGAKITKSKEAKDDGRILCYLSPKEKIADCFGEFTEDIPLPLSYYIPEFEYKKGEVLATVTEPVTDPYDNLHYGSIHSNPPAIKTKRPAMMEVSYGKGKVLWSLAKLEADGRKGIKEVFVNIIKRYISNSLFNVKSNDNVEIITFIDSGKLYMNFYNYGYKYMPEIKNSAEVIFDKEIAVSAAKDETITNITKSSFKVDFNVFACVIVDLK